jgi:hypothetical protein
MRSVAPRRGYGPWASASRSHGGRVTPEPERLRSSASQPPEGAGAKIMSAPSIFVRSWGVHGSLRRRRTVRTLRTLRTVVLKRKRQDEVFLSAGWYESPDGSDGSDGGFQKFGPRSFFLWMAGTKGGAIRTDFRPDRCLSDFARGHPPSLMRAAVARIHEAGVLPPGTVSGTEQNAVPAS